MRLLRRSLALMVAIGVPAVLVAGNASAQESSAIDVMARANEGYERGEYVEASQQYEALIDRGYSDATLYFNLGNSYLESGDLGRAILSYLRARELSPRDTEIRDSLELARGMTVDRVVAEGGSPVESVSYFGQRWATRNELGIAAILLWGCQRGSRLRPHNLAGLSPEECIARLRRPGDFGYSDDVPVGREHDIRQSIRHHRRCHRCGSRNCERARAAVFRRVHPLQRRAGASHRLPSRLAQDRTSRRRTSGLGRPLTPWKLWEGTSEGGLPSLGPTLGTGSREQGRPKSWVREIERSSICPLS